LEELDGDLRARLLTVFDLIPSVATGLVDRCLIRQAKKPESNWPGSKAIESGAYASPATTRREEALRSRQELCNSTDPKTG